MSKEVNGELYNTYIYDFDGELMELMARDDLNMIYPPVFDGICGLYYENAPMYSKSEVHRGIVCDKF